MKIPLLSNIKKVPGMLKMMYARGGEAEEGDLCYIWGEGVDKRDSHLLHYIFHGRRYDHVTRHLGKSFQEELVERGYDLTTLKFSIRKKEMPT